jgi:hypothetical protein
MVGLGEYTERRGVGMGYIARPSMNSCRCSVPNLSEQRREVLASVDAKSMSINKLIDMVSWPITYHLLDVSVVVNAMTYQNASR